MAKTDTHNNSGLPALPAQHPRAGCCVIVRADGMVLGVTLEEGADLEGHADPGEHPDLYNWGTPGGGCEGHESPEDCARRETFEETGYLVTDLFPVHAQLQRGCLSHGFTGRVVAAELGAPRGAPREGAAAWIAPIHMTRGPYAAFNTQVLLKLGLLTWVASSHGGSPCDDPEPCWRLRCTTSGVVSKRHWAAPTVAL